MPALTARPKLAFVQRRVYLTFSIAFSARWPRGALPLHESGSCCACSDAERRQSARPMTTGRPVAPASSSREHASRRRTLASRRLAPTLVGGGGLALRNLEPVTLDLVGLAGGDGLALGAARTPGESRSSRQCPGSAQSCMQPWFRQVAFHSSPSLRVQSVSPVLHAHGVLHSAGLASHSTSISRVVDSSTTSGDCTRSGTCFENMRSSPWRQPSGRLAFVDRCGPPSFSCVQ